MKAPPHRIKDQPGTRFGRLIDRSQPLDFRFDGRRLTGVAGDTVASALLANGLKIAGRSFKLHRPRGTLGIGAEEPNALVTVEEAGHRTPNLRATMVSVTPGMVVESQNRWPSLRRDIAGFTNLMKPLLPPGFYYKTFKWPAKLWPFYERLIRKAGGLGRAPATAPDDRYEHVHLHVDVLVAGGGLAGICAAEAAAAEGLTVLLAEETSRLGGIADGYDGSIDGLFLLDWIRARVAALAALPNVHILTQAPVVALHEHGYSWLVEKLSGPSGPDVPRERLWKVRARETVVATGAHEKPLVFPDNDRPGIMLATAARLNLRRYAVAPGQHAVVVTSGDEGYRTALDLNAAGVDVELVVDLRLRPDSPMVDIGKAMGLRVSHGSAPVAVGSIWGGASIDSVTVANRLVIEGPALKREIFCDTVLMSGGWSPAAQLIGNLGTRLPFDAALGAYRPGDLPAGVHVVGAANGAFNAADVAAQGWQAGEAAALRLKAGKKSPLNRIAADIDVTRDDPAEPVGMLPDTARRSEEARAFVDFHNDVTVGDLRIAVREGYRDAEHVKRYTALGLGPDQGKTTHANAAVVLAKLTGIDIERQPHVTFRPPWTPISFGVIAGPRQGRGFRPIRRSPIETLIAGETSLRDSSELWQRPSCYPQVGEGEEEAVRREARMVRSNVGVMDVSTLGKFLMAGSDAARFLDLILSTDVGDMLPGAARYALLLDDGGFVIDDGVVACLAPNRYLLTTTTARAEKTRAHLERWRQTEWPGLDVHVIDETERWGQFLLSGPQAREVLETIEGGAELLAGRSVAEGLLANSPARVLRTRYTGERSFEIAVPTGRTPALWSLLREKGATPFGLQTLERLRLEAGHIAIGHETDGTVTPFDLGLGHLVSAQKADFIGKHGLMRADLTRAKRKQLVGLIPEDATVVPAPGTQIVETPAASPPRRTSGHITSSGFSPAAGRAVALALIANGRSRIGKTVTFFHAGEARQAQVTEPGFLKARP
ncbi:sarcosine oxidase subunit alpha [Agaricicola taiwanensis]|uniref:Sarcosine oxidase subunit alpha n=1 Tax=Agaricicola taiwanensis TaxID=591372 RepID=A0A8J2YGQ0_9RHOB|nr:2Fe-2S iron-sulfur cluster-binding protein [Agaricicola taiwanensis]GGE37060.1 sarcosine oxidase subunit alpha [Agaricicola taiwanensis]